MLWTVAVLAAIAALFFGLGRLLADAWTVETVRLLAIDRGRIAAVLADLPAWQQWCTVDPVLGANTERRVESARAEHRGRIVWNGAQGEAALTFTALDADVVRYAWTIRTVPIGSGSIRLRPVAGGTEVCWTDDGRLPNVGARWVGWFGALQEAVRKQQETSIANLASRIEAADAAAGPPAGAPTDK